MHRYQREKRLVSNLQTSWRYVMPHPDGLVSTRKDWLSRSHSLHQCIHEWLQPEHVSPLMPFLSWLFRLHFCKNCRWGSTGVMKLITRWDCFPRRSRVRGRQLTMDASFFFDRKKRCKQNVSCLLCVLEGEEATWAPLVPFSQVVDKKNFPNVFVVDFFMQKHTWSRHGTPWRG